MVMLLKNNGSMNSFVLIGVEKKKKCGTGCRVIFGITTDKTEKSWESNKT